VLGVSAAIQIVTGIIVSAADIRSTVIVIAILCLQTVQIVILVFTSTQIFQRMRSGFVHPYVLISMFGANILAFAGFYTLCYAISNEAFFIAENPGLAEFSGVDVFALYLYYSITIMTSTGLGDISPRSWYAQLFTIVQMLFAVLYYAGIFTAGVFQYRRYQLKSAEQDELEDHQQESLSHWNRFVSFMSRLPLWPQISRWISLPLILVTWIICGIFGYSLSSDSKVLLSFVWIIQLLQLLCLLTLTVQLTDQLRSHTLSLRVLAKSYISVIFYFSTLYSSIASTSSAGGSFRFPSSKNSLLETLYLSVSCQTNTGLGDIHPISSIARIAVGAQILLSVLISVGILGLGLAEIAEKILF
jgi:hypothetical protein